jgi:sulfonate transport system permease protein
MNKTWGNRILPWVLPFMILLAWQFVASMQIVSTRLFPSPIEVALACWELVLTGQLFFHMKASLTRAVIGALIGGGIGFLLGITNALSLTSFRLFDTTIQMIRNIPHLALVPLVIVWMGIDEGAKIFLVALGVLFPVYVNTYHGIRTVEADYIEMGKVYGLSGWELFRQIILPGALPSIFVGVRYALGVMWLTLIVAETIATNEGIGYLAMNAREFMQADIIIISIILYALFGKAADWIARWCERSVLRWHPNYRNMS